jgi:hypothetical protein
MKIWMHHAIASAACEDGVKLTLTKFIYNKMERLHNM